MNEPRGLVQDLQRGDPLAFEELIATFGGRILHLARRFAETEADAEDITQEVLVAVARQIKTFRGESSLATYIYRITLNLGQKHRQRVLSRRVSDTQLIENLPWMLSPSIDPARFATRRELAERVDTALLALTPEHREAILLHELHGLTYIECAELLGVPEGTIKSRVSYGCRQLRRLLDPYVNETNDTSELGEINIPSTVSYVT
jgi:RNA polymerase sigma-70 factor, ECF subfamily